METSARDPLKRVTPRHSLQVRDSYRNRFGLKDIIITGEASSADEEAPVTFLAETKKLIKVLYYLRFQASPGARGGLERMPHG